jgi:DNA-binding response OmpR family regulator
LRIAVLEDDDSQAALVVHVLEAAGHSCVHFSSGLTLQTRLRQETFDLLVLDWNVPHISGLEIAQWARSQLSPPPPMLMVTARSDSEDIVQGLDAGADDFIVKPIDPAILLARVQAVLRRVYPAETGPRSETFGDYVFDPAQLVVTWNGPTAQLTAKEFALAQLLFRNLNRALSRSYLLETVWGRNPNVPTRTLDTHVSRVRTKLGLRPEAGYRLAPVYSYGYRLEQFGAERGLSDDR